MPRLVRTRLSVMMFLFFFSLGAWAVTLSTYLMSAPTRHGLNFTTVEVGWIYSTFAFGGMLAPLLIGLLADRLFRAERVLGVTGLLCAGLLVAAASWCDERFPEMKATYERVAAVEPDPDRVNDHPAVRRVAADTFRPLFWTMLAYCVCLQIGLTLTTVITLRNLPDPSRGFSRTRMYGTVGWIVAGNVVGLALAPVSPQPLYLAAVAAGAVGVYAFTLPPTLPKGGGRTLAEAFGLPALRLFRDPSFGVFVGVTFTVSAMNQFYGVYAHRFLTDLGVRRPEQMMTVGQVVEVACMFAIPILSPKRWTKALMVVGLVGWVVRGLAMTFGGPAVVVVVGVPMHGWSYAFYYMVGATYLDREAPPTLRASAQGIITFASGGLGVWVGNLFAGRVVDAHRAGTVIDWPAVWLVPLVGCAVALVVFVAFFKPPPDRPPATP